MIAAFITQYTLVPDVDISVNVGPTEVMIEQGDTRIVVPRAVHDTLQQVERSPLFRDSLGRVMQAVEKDHQISSLGFSPTDEPEPPIQIPRDRFAVLPDFISEVETPTRDLEEVTDLRILRAILERSRRRWEFVWGGMKISAPVTDDNFYDAFFAHDITIAPGDALRVRLRIRQRRAADIGVYINESYEVVEVLDHIPRDNQPRLTLGDDDPST